MRNWEEPVASDEEMAKLRRVTGIPFSAHLADPLRAQRLGAPGAIVAGAADRHSLKLADRPRAVRARGRGRGR